MKAENRNQLVRGRVIFGQWGSGYISLDNAEDKNNVRCTVVYTAWHRGDDLGNIDNELQALARLVMTFDGVDGASISYEYRDYNKR